MIHKIDYTNILTRRPMKKAKITIWSLQRCLGYLLRCRRSEPPLNVVSAEHLYYTKSRCVRSSVCPSIPVCPPAPGLRGRLHPPVPPRNRTPGLEPHRPWTPRPPPSFARLASLRTSPPSAQPRAPPPLLPLRSGDAPRLDSAGRNRWGLELASPPSARSI